MEMDATVSQVYFGMNDSINYSNDYVYNTQYRYGYKAMFKSYTQDIYNDISESTENVQWIQESSVDISFEGSEVSGAISILSSGDYIHLETAEGEDIELPDSGIVITKKFAKELGVNVGDTVKFTVTGIAETFEAEVTQITSALYPQGLFISEEAWSEIHDAFTPTSILLEKNDYDEVNDNNYFKEITSIEKQKTNMDDLTDSVNTIIKLCSIIAIKYYCSV